MRHVELFNLNVGGTLPPPGLREVTLGRWVIALHDDYAVRVAGMSRNRSKRQTLDPDAPRQVEWVAARPGDGWTATAVATLHGNGPAESSVFGRLPSKDEGLDDICTLLTFLTGRRVATEANLERWRPNIERDSACLPIETLGALARAWEYRQSLQRDGLSYALLTYTEGLCHEDVQVSGLLWNTSLDVVLSAWPGLTKESLSPEAKKEIRAVVMQALSGYSFTHATREEVEAMSALIAGRIAQGSASAHSQSVAMLQALEIVETPLPKPTEKRVRYINSVRNALVHKGRLPPLEGLDEERAFEVGLVVLAGIVPEMIRLAIGRRLGFSRKSVGSLSQDESHLRTFFATGSWRGWCPEVEPFDDWFFEPGILVT